MSTGLEAVRNLAMTSRPFRDQLQVDPKAAVQKVGLTLSRTEMSTLIADLDRLKASKTAAELDEVFRAGALGWRDVG
jgi:hypothetical protein